MHGRRLSGRMVREGLSARRRLEPLPDHVALPPRARVGGTPFADARVPAKGHDTPRTAK